MVYDVRRFHPIAIEQLTILLRIDAFCVFGVPKKQVLWQAVFKTKAHRKDTVQRLLFKPKHRHFTLPHLPPHPVEDAYDQMDLLGFPLCGYYELMESKVKSRLTANDFEAHVNQKVWIYGSLVHTRLNTTSKGDTMRFTTMLDLEGHFFDCVHFPQSMASTPIHGKGIYLCHGTVTEEFGHYSLEVILTLKQPLKPDPRQEGKTPVKLA